MREVHQRPCLFSDPFFLKTFPFVFPLKRIPDQDPSLSFAPVISRVVIKKWVPRYNESCCMQKKSKKKKKNKKESKTLNSGWILRTFSPKTAAAHLSEIKYASTCYWNDLTDWFKWLIDRSIHLAAISLAPAIHVTVIFSPFRLSLANLSAIEGYILFDVTFQLGQKATLLSSFTSQWGPAAWTHSLTRSINKQSLSLFSSEQGSATCVVCN